MGHRKTSSPLMLVTLLFAVIPGGCDSRQERALKAYDRYQAAKARNDLAESRRELLALVTADDSVADYWIELGKVHLQLGEYAAAFEAYNRAHELDRANASVLGMLTQLELRSGDVDRAEQSARELDLVSPGDPTVLLARGYIALRRGHFDEANKQADQLLATSPYDPSAKILRARILLGTDKQAEAVTLLREQVQSQPSDEASLRALYALYELLDDYANSGWVARNLLIWQPDDREFQVKLVESELRAGKTEMARADTAAALTNADAQQVNALMAPWISVGAQAKVADLMLARGLTGTGEQRLTFARNLGAASRWPDVARLAGAAATLPVAASNVMANALYGTALAMTGRSAEGTARLDDVIALDPTNRDALYGRARVRQRARSYNFAIEDAQKLIAADRTSTTAWLLLADLYRSTGSIDQTRRTLWDAFHENPTQRPIFDALQAIVVKMDGPEAGNRIAEEFRGQRRDELARSFI